MKSENVAFEDGSEWAVLALPAYRSHQSQSQPEAQEGGPMAALRVILLLAIAIVAALCAPAWCADTAMFRGDPQHTGIYQASGVLHSPHIKWKFHTAGAVISSAAVADGLVYVGSTDGNLYAIDRETGTLRWKFATKSRVVSSPAVAHGVVYFSSYDGHLYAVDGASGKVKWKFQTAGEHRFEGTHLHGFQPVAETMPDVFDVYLSSPTVWHDGVFFGSSDGNVYALNAASGALRWKFKTQDVVHASPAISNDTLFIGSWDSYFYALNALTGQEEWRFKTAEDSAIHNQVGVQSSAAVMSGKVYFGCRDSHLYALDARSGRKEWAFPTQGSWVVGSPAVKKNSVYFATSDSSILYEVASASGAPVLTLKFKGWPFFSSPAIAGDTLYIGSWDGQLTAIDLKQRKVTWTFLTDGARTFGPSLTKADGSPKYEAAYRSDFYDDMVVGYNKMMTVGSILASPVIVGNVVYVGSTDGNLYALI